MRRGLDPEGKEYPVLKMWAQIKEQSDAISNMKKFWKDEEGGNPELVKRIKHIRESEYGHLSEAYFEYLVILPLIENSSEPGLQKEVERIKQNKNEEVLEKRERRLMAELQQKQMNAAMKRKEELAEEYANRYLKLNGEREEKDYKIPYAQFDITESHIYHILKTYKEPTDSLSIESITENLPNSFKNPERIIRNVMSMELLLLDKIDYVFGKPSMFLTLSQFGIDIWINMDRIEIGEI